MMKNVYNPKIVWGKEWSLKANLQLKKLYNQRLFIEGYPIFKKYIPSNAKQILIVGAGTGRYGFKIAEDFPNSEVMITDITEESIKLISKLSKNLQNKNISIKKEDVFKLNFFDNYFDVVFCAVVLQHIPDYAKTVKEMRRVLKPGGRLIISNVNFWNSHTFYKWLLKVFKKKYVYDYEKSFTKKEMRNLLSDNNIKLVAEDGFYPAYGIYRLKYEFPRLKTIFSFLGKVINRLTKLFDKFTNRFFSRYLGIEILVIGEKRKA